MLKVSWLSQEDEEDCPEEIKRLEDRVEALAILKDYTSPWPVGIDGMPIADGLDISAEDLTKGPASDKVCILDERLLTSCKGDAFWNARAQSTNQSNRPFRDLISISVQYLVCERYFS